MSGFGYTVQITAPKMKQAMAKLERFPVTANEELTKAMKQTVEYVAGAAIDEAPVGVSGMMRASIGGEVIHSVGLDIVGRVGTSVEYGWYVEHGTKPHWAPIAPLMLWVERKLGVPDNQVYGVAKAIQRKIAANGTKANPFLQRGYEKSKEKIEGFFARALERIAERLVW